MDSLYYRRSIVEGSLTSRKNIPPYASVASSREMKTSCRYSIHFARYIYQSPNVLYFQSLKTLLLIFLCTSFHYRILSTIFTIGAIIFTADTRIIPLLFSSPGVACFLYSKPLGSTYTSVLTTRSWEISSRVLLTSRLLPERPNLYGLKPKGEARVEKDPGEKE